MADIQKIGPYQIVEQVGAGGMATVYKAYQEKLDRHVAVKVMHQSFLHDGEFLLRFEREAKIVANLDHPNIVPVYDYDEYENRPYLVMKLLDGLTLKEVLRQGPLDLDDIQSVMRKVAGALDYAHGMGVLHRDMKPANIIIDYAGEPYITDFGLARIVQAGESSLSADTMLGTPNYISPEQAEGISNLDARTDVYSFGVILYELVTGRVPFTGDTPYAIVHKHIYDPPPRASTIDPEIPPAVDSVLMKALAKEPDARYATPITLMKAFNRAVAASGLTALDQSRAAPRPAQLPAPPESAVVYPVDDGSGKYISVRVVSGSPEPEPTNLNELVRNVADRIGSIFGDVSKELGERDGFKKLTSGISRTARQVRVAVEDGVAERSGAAVSPDATSQQEQRRLRVINEDWGFDEASVRRRVNSRMNQRRRFFVHVFLYVVAIIFISGPVQTNALEGLQELYVQPEVIDAFIEQTGSAETNFLAPLEQIDLGLVAALLWAPILIGHGLAVFYNSGGRLTRKRNTLERQLELRYGGDLARYGERTGLSSGASQSRETFCKASPIIITHYWRAADCGGCSCCLGSGARESESDPIRDPGSG